MTEVRRGFQPESGAYGHSHVHHSHDDEGHGGHSRQSVTRAIRTDSVPGVPRLLQLASPALACGAYSYSQGLGWAIECGDVHDAATAQRWIEDHLTLVMARF